MEKYIHIHAKCEAFEIMEQIPETKAVNRLIKIRKNFEWSSGRVGYGQDKLVVKTIVVNPELPFINCY